MEIWIYEWINNHYERSDKKVSTTIETNVSAVFVLEIDLIPCIESTHTTLSKNECEKWDGRSRLKATSKKSCQWFQNAEWEVHRCSQMSCWTLDIFFSNFKKLTKTVLVMKAEKT